MKQDLSMDDVTTQIPEAGDEDFASLFGKNKAKKGVKRAEKKKEKEAKKVARQEKRAARKLTRQERKAERKFRREQRRLKRQRGEALSAEELADEELDALEAKQDGDLDEASQIGKDMDENDERDYGAREFPMWAKVSLGVLGVAALGFGIYAGLKWASKGSPKPAMA